MRFRFSRQAEIDIEEIGDFIARDNPARAVSYIQELRAKCEQLRKDFAISAGLLRCARNDGYLRVRRTFEPGH